MKTVKYICTHCSKKFEAEEKDIIECPGCFWSSSVKKEEDYVEEKAALDSASKVKKSKLGISFRLPLKEIVTVLLILAVGYLSFLVWPKIQSALKQLQSSAPKTVIKIDNKKEKPEKPEKSKAGQPGVSAANQNLSPVLSTLTEEDRAVLSRRLNFDANREPSDEEKKILSTRADYQTGIVEKLPYQAWTLEDFKKMVGEQEKFFQVPLPRSYKGKLDDLFKTKYLPGAAAFEAGELLKARDFWVESLAIPMYSSDIQKHRGVALTMLKPFINDTLSKIGTINSTLSEQNVRGKEIEVAQKYDELFGSIQKKDWENALSLMDRMNQLFQAIERPELLGVQAPPYPPAIAHVDTDIQATLQGILKASPSSTSDVGPLRRDLELKRFVLESFIPARLEAALRYHGEALDQIARENWQDAEKKLRQIQYPITLVKDAQEKVRILKKLESTSDHPVNAG